MRKVCQNSAMTIWQYTADGLMFHSGLTVSIEMVEQTDKDHCQWCGRLTVTQGFCNFCSGPSDGTFSRVGSGLAHIRGIVPYGLFLLTLPDRNSFDILYRHAGRRDVYDEEEIFLRMRNMKVISRKIPNIIIRDPYDQDVVYTEVILEGEIQIVNDEWDKFWSET